MTTVRPLKNRLLVHNFKRGERNIGGIVIPDDDGTERGVRSRWAQVYAVGKEVVDIETGNWIYIQHGRWSRETKVTEDLTIWSVDYPDGVLLVSNEEPEDEGFLR